MTVPTQCEICGLPRAIWQFHNQVRYCGLCRRYRWDEVVNLANERQTLSTKQPEPERREPECQPQS